MKSASAALIEIAEAYLTPKDKRNSMQFELSVDGICSAVEWLETIEKISVKTSHKIQDKLATEYTNIPQGEQCWGYFWPTDENYDGHNYDEERGIYCLLLAEAMK